MKINSISDNFVSFKYLLINSNRYSIVRIIILIMIGSLLEIFSIYTAIPFFSKFTGNVINSTQFFEFYNYIKFYINLDQSKLVGLIFILTLAASNFYKLFLIDVLNKFSFDLGDILNRNLLLKIFDLNDNKIRDLDHSVVIDSYIQKNNVLVFGTIMPILQVIYGSFYIFSLTLALVVLKGSYVLLGFIIIFIFYYLVTLFTKTKILNSGNILTKCSEDRTSLITQIINNNKNIILDNKIDSILIKNSELNRNKNKSNLTYYHYSNLPRLVLELIIWILVFTFSELSFGNNDNSSSLASLTLITLVMIRLLPIAQQVYANLHSIKISAASSNEYLSLTKLIDSNYTFTSESLPKNDNLMISDTDFILTCRNIYYKRSPIDNFLITDLSLSIRPGEWHLICGPSGCGKSTLFNILLGLSLPTHGSLLLNSINISHDSIKKILHKNISYVPQRIFLYSGTILDNLVASTLDGHYDIADLNKILLCCDLTDFIEELPLGICSKVIENGANFSGGQIQKIGIARALFKKPRIIFLDESTSAIDKSSELKILQNIKNFFPTTSVVMISHNQNLKVLFDKITDFNQ